LINARAAPGTLCVDMRRSIRASEAEKSAADTEVASVTTATAKPTAHIAGGRPHQLRGPDHHDKILRAHPAGRRSQPSRRGRVLLTADAEDYFSRLYRPRENGCYGRYLTFIMGSASVGFPLLRAIRTQRRNRPQSTLSGYSLQATATGEKCPTPAVRGTRRDRLNWVFADLRQSHRER
jgi:hypothetical protein